MVNRNYFDKRLLKYISRGGDIRSITSAIVRQASVPTESEIQQACIDWFKHRYPKEWSDGMLFHVANEGIRSGRMGARFKREGIVRGVADLCLSIPRQGYGALYIEMKRPRSYQSPEQRRWGANASAYGNRYVVCRSVEEFAEVVKEYLGSGEDHITSDNKR